MVTKNIVPVIPVGRFDLTGKQQSDLARRLQNREAQAATELYTQMWRITYSVILAIVRDRAVSEELVQETFWRVWNRIQTFEASSGTFGNWVVVIARNRAIDYVRSSRRGMIHQNLRTFSAEAHPALFVYLEPETMRREHADLIRGAMGKLKREQQRVIELAYYEGMTQTEMAAKLGTPLGTIKTLVRKALNHLRQELAYLGLPHS